MKTASISLFQKPAFKGAPTDWTARIFYRNECVITLGANTAQEALTVAERRAIGAGFTHAKVTETHPHRAEVKVYTKKLTGEALKVQFVIEPEPTPLPALGSIEDRERTFNTYKAAGKAGKLQWAGFYVSNKRVHEVEWKTLSPDEVSGLLGQHVLECFRIKPESAPEPIPQSFPPTPKVRLATIETRLQSTFWYEVKVKHGKKPHYREEAIDENSGIEAALKWAANDGFTHYQVNQDPTIRELNPMPAPQPETKTCTLFTKAYMGNRSEAIIHDGKKQLHCASASNAQDAIALALAWAALHGFTHCTDQYTKKTEPIPSPENVKTCIIKVAYDETNGMWTYYVGISAKVTQGFANTQRKAQIAAEDQARKDGCTHYKTSPTSLVYKL